MPRLRCRYCCYCCDRMLHLVKHIFETHSFDPTFAYVCGINGCIHLFKVGSTYSSFKTHANRKHPKWKDEMENITPPDGSVVPRNSLTSLEGRVALSVRIPNEESSFNDIDPVVVPGAVLDETSSFHSPERTAAMFLLTFKEKYKLPQASINFAVSAINQIVVSVCESVKMSVKSSAQELTNEEIASRIQCQDPFASLQTEYQQTKFYRDVFGLVVSCYTCRQSSDKI